jgi:hypothetical protein
MAATGSNGQQGFQTKFKWANGFLPTKEGSLLVMELSMGWCVVGVH